MMDDCRGGGNIGDGWVDIAREFITKARELSPEIKIFQIKEKFGGLRIYFSLPREKGLSKSIEILEDSALSKSYRTCEFCGKPGKLRNDFSWIKTVCEEHYQEALKRKGWSGDEENSELPN